MKPIRAPLVAVLALALAVEAAAQQAAQPSTPPRMRHLAAGKEQCLTCHGPGANEHIRSTPQGHAFANEACPMCHRPSETPPPNVPHDLGDAFSDCRMCHVANSPAGAPAPPAWHENFHVSLCRMCHQPATPGR